jgi:multiple antibiotic resistance protein
MKLSSDVTTLVALFAIVSPITSIPVFLTLTSGASTKKRRVIAMQTAAVSGATLLIAYFVGDVILRLLSIQIEAFRVAGALVIGAIGWSMVMGKKSTIFEAQSSGAMVVPLAIPLMAGLTGIILLAAAPIEKYLGAQGLMVLTRIFELLLLSLAVSTVMSSLTNYIHSL